MKTLYIIDASAYIHRAYHAIRPLTASDGTPTNAVYGFIKLINKIKNEKKPDYIAVCFDHPSKNFRHELSPQYKANRTEIDVDLIKQMPIAREAVKAMNLHLLEKSGFEADDLIGTLAKKAEEQGIFTVIVTGDKDLFQLVDDNIQIWNESKNIMFDRQKVYEKYGIYPEQIVDMLALMGDACDNITGIKGIGEKTAVKLLQEYKTLENIIENAASLKGKLAQTVKEGAESAILSKKLVQLELNAPIDYSIDDMKFDDNLFSNAADFLKKYEFQSFLKQDHFQNIFKITEKTEKVKEITPQIKRPEDSEPHIPINIPDVKIADSVESALELKKILETKDNITISVETNGYDFTSSFLVGISFFYGQDAVYYVPVNHSDFTLKQLPAEDFKNVFGGLFESDKIKFTGYDLKFVKHILKKHHIALKNSFCDVMIASYCIDPSRRHDLENLAETILSFKIDSEESLLGKGSKKITPDILGVDTLSKYSGTKAYLINRLADKFLKELKLKNLDKLFFEMEMPVLSVLTEMEETGIKIDESFLKTFDEKITKEISESENKIFKISQIEFNINSPKQLAEILFEKMNLPAVKKTKTGYSTDESVLSELSGYEIANEILKYRELQKIKTTYIDSMLRYCGTEGCRIHTILNQAVTTTGRLSSSEPNLQNIPVRTDYGRQIRRAFIADIGNIFISADYSQIDLRALAHISGDKTLIDAFNNGRDIHTATAMEIFSAPSERDVTPQMRSAAKSINFGIVYGISPFGLSKQLGIPVQQAKEYIDNYFKKYSGVKQWTFDVTEQAKKTGFVKTLSGRIRYIPEINSSNKQTVSFGERMALNTPVQGTSADIIKIAMINISNKIKEQKLNSKLLLQVHDDLLFETPEEEKNIMIKMIKYEMEHAMELKVPLAVDMKAGINWAEMDKI